MQAPLPFSLVNINILVLYLSLIGRISRVMVPAPVTNAISNGVDPLELPPKHAKGSSDDLFVLNKEELARTIAEFRIGLRPLDQMEENQKENAVDDLSSKKDSKENEEPSEDHCGKNGFITLLRLYPSSSLNLTFPLFILIKLFTSISYN